MYVIDPDTGVKTKLLGDAGTAEVEAVAVYARAVHPLFESMPTSRTRTAIGRVAPRPT